MGFLDDVEKGLDWLAKSGSSYSDTDIAEMRGNMARDVKAWAEAEVNQFIQLAGDALPPIAQGLIRSKLMKFAEDAYSRGVNDAIKIRDAESSSK